MMDGTLDGHEDYPARPYAWSVVGILVATAILAYTDRQVLSLVVDPIRSDLGIDDTKVSLLLGTSFAVIYGIAGIPLGWLADRVSRRNLILAGLVVWSLATLACGFTRDFGQLFTARIFVGLGEAVLSPAAISLISDYFPPSRRGTAIGLYLTGIAMGIGGAMLIGGALLRLIESGLVGFGALAPWRILLILIGAPGLVWSLVILAIREPVRRGSAEVTADEGGAGPVALLSIAPIFLAVALASLVDNAVGAWAPTLLIREFATDPAQVGVLLGLLLMAGFGGGVLIGGVLADRAGARAGFKGKLQLCLIVALIIVPASLLVASGNFFAVLLGVPLYFALSGMVTATGFSTILDFVPNRSRGLAMAVSFFLNVAIGAGFGPTAVALAGAHIFGTEAGLGSPLAFTIASFYGLAALAILVQFRLSKNKFQH
jgi:MFS family permease